MSNYDLSFFDKWLTKEQNYDHIDWLDDIREAEQASVARTGFDEGLAKRVQNLPPELYDLIYKATFSFSPGERCIYHERVGQYEPPAVLQVDRASRSLAAESYYKNTAFCFAVKARDDREEFVLVYDNPAQRWILSLTQEHRSEMRKVRVACCGNTLAWVNIEYVSFGDLGMKPELLDAEATWYGVHLVVGLNGGPVGEVSNDGSGEGGN